MFPVRRYARYWLAYLTGGGLVLIAVLSAKKNTNPSNERNNGESEQKGRVDEEPIPCSRSQSEYASFDSPHQKDRAKSQQNSANDGENEDKGFLSRLTINEWLTFGVGCGTLVVGLGSLFISYFTYQNAADTSDIKNAVSKLSALAADTKRAADAEASQVDDFRQDLRPVVYLRRTDIPRQGPNGYTYVKRRLANAGRGTALNVTRVTWSSFFPKIGIPGNGADLIYPGSADFDKAQVDGFIPPMSDAPGDSVSQSTDVEPESAWQLVGSGSVVWVEWGGVMYEDVFGKQHHYWFCHYWDGRSQQVASCPRTKRGD